MATTRSYESMLDSVLHARDRFLRPGGVMAPSQCDILLSAVEDQDFVDKHLTWWNDVYGKCLLRLQVPFPTVCVLNLSENSPVRRLQDVGHG